MEPSKPKTLDFHSGFFLFLFFCQKPQRLSDRLTRLWEKRKKKTRVRGKPSEALLQRDSHGSSLGLWARLSLPELARLASVPQRGEVKGFFSGEVPEAAVAVGGAKLVLGVKVAERGGGVEEGAGWCNSDTMFVSFSCGRALTTKTTPSFYRTVRLNNPDVCSLFTDLMCTRFRSLFTSFLW